MQLIARREERMALHTVKWILILMYWVGGTRSVELEFNSEKSCHLAAAQINQMLESHLVASGQTQERARQLLAKDYVCIPKG
jgi:hypothetical protein